LCSIGWIGSCRIAATAEWPLTGIRQSLGINRAMLIITTQNTQEIIMLD
jgi:hypothetical protein